MCEPKVKENGNLFIAVWTLDTLVDKLSFQILNSVVFTWNTSRVIRFYRLPQIFMTKFSSVNEIKKLFHFFSFSA